jgi:O-antigen/teichoic acid export membrane protein
MTFKRKIVHNISFLGMAEAFSNLLSFLLIILVTRALGVEGLGIYAFAFAFVGLFMVFYDFGVSTVFIKKVSGKREIAEEIFAQYASLKLLFCSLAMVLPAIAILFIQQNWNIILVVWLAALSMFLQNYSYAPRNAFQAFQEMKYDALIRIVERLFAFFLGAYVLLNGYGLISFMLVLVISNAMSLFYSIFLLRRIHIRFQLRFDKNAWRDILKTSWPFWLSTVFLQLYFYFDTVMLTFLKGYFDTGIYNAAYKLIGVLTKIPFLLVLVLFPVLSELYAKLSKDVLNQVMDKGTHLLIILSVPIMVGVTLLSGRIIQFIYKETFLESSVVLAILVWTTFFTFLSYMLGWFLNAADRQRPFAYVTGSCLVANFLLNLLLIPPYSYVGASIATVVTAMVNLGLLVHIAKETGYEARIVQRSVKPVFGAMIMGAFIFLWGGGIHLLALVPLSAAIYVAFLATVGEITKEDFKGAW